MPLIEGCRFTRSSCSRLIRCREIDCWESLRLLARSVVETLIIRSLAPNSASRIRVCKRFVFNFLPDDIRASVPPAYFMGERKLTNAKWTAVYMRFVECFLARGHKNITARNRTTFEFTKETHLTRRGDCILAVGADKGAVDLNEEFKSLARNEGSKIKATIRTGDTEVVVSGYGSPRLTFLHPTDMVGRRSDFICDRTLLIRANKTASDFPKEFVAMLTNPLQLVQIKLVVEV